MDEEALAVEPVSAGDDLDAVGFALVEVTQDAGELFLADQRADQTPSSLGPPCCRLLRDRSAIVDELLVDAALREDA